MTLRNFLLAIAMPIAMIHIRHRRRRIRTLVRPVPDRIGESRLRGELRKLSRCTWRGDPRLEKQGGGRDVSPAAAQRHRPYVAPPVQGSRAADQVRCPRWDGKNAGVPRLAHRRGDHRRHRMVPEPMARGDLHAVVADSATGVEAMRNASSERAAQGRQREPARVRTRAGREGPASGARWRGSCALRAGVVSIRPTCDHEEQGRYIGPCTPQCPEAPIRGPGPTLAGSGIPCRTEGTADTPFLQELPKFSTIRPWASRPSNGARACPRWLTAFFSARESSAADRPSVSMKNTGS